MVSKVFCELAHAAAPMELSSKLQYELRGVLEHLEPLAGYATEYINYRGCSKSYYTMHRHACTDMHEMENGVPNYER